MKIIAKRGVNILSDANAQWMVKVWLKEFRRHNPKTWVHVWNIEMEKDFVTWLKGEPRVKVTRCLKKIRETRFETRTTILRSESPFEVTIATDVDCIPQGCYDALYEAFEDVPQTFGGCPDMFYPWTFRPSERTSTRFFPVMSGLIIFNAGSQVMADWLHILKTWKAATRIDGMGYSFDGKDWKAIPSVMHIGNPNNAFRDDMQALSQIYRIGHPDVWEMPEKTQWFRLMDGSPDEYLAAHYTGADGKALMKAKYCKNEVCK